MTHLILAAILGTCPVEAHITSHLPDRPWRAAYVRELVAAARVEGARRGLNPMAILAVGRVESGWMPTAHRPQDGSHGPYQLMSRDTGPREALALLRGCATPRGTGRAGEPCEAPEIAGLRSASGAWTPRELRHPRIATYIVAHEVQRHILACHLRRRCRHPRIPSCPAWLVRWGHFNSGHNPLRRYYLTRLCRFFAELKTAQSRTVVVF